MYDTVHVLYITCQFVTNRHAALLSTLDKFVDLGRQSVTKCHCPVITITGIISVATRQFTFVRSYRKTTVSVIQYLIEHVSVNAITLPRCKSYYFHRLSCFFFSIRIFCGISEFWCNFLAIATFCIAFIFFVILTKIAIFRSLIKKLGQKHSSVVRNKPKLYNCLLA